MIKQNFKAKASMQTVFCAGLTAMIIAGCGKKSDDSPAPAQQTVGAPIAAQPTPAPGAPTPTPSQSPLVGSVSADALAVDISNRSAIEGQTIQSNAMTVQFGLKNTQGQALAGISYHCKIESGSQSSATSSTCTSPYTVPAQQAGQYTLTVFAVHDATQTTGAPTQLTFVVGNNGQVTGIPAGQVGQGQNGQGQIGQGGGQMGQGQIGQGGVGGGMGGMGPMSASAQQVGDMFTVNVPQGFHMVYRTSTFDTPGMLNFQYINGGRATDAAAPYPFNCQTPESSQYQQYGSQNNIAPQFQMLQTATSGSGQQLQYCSITPTLNWNSSNDPVLNSFRWMNMNTMSYNAMAMASDNSLASANAPIGSMQPAMAKMYVNVFTNVSGLPTSAAQSPFTNEMSSTVSRLNVACAGQTPQYMGNAAIFQGYFNFQLAATPLFGCVTPRNNQWYVEVGAFPMEQNMPILATAGWGNWIGQSFANTRAAEIVVELGPYPNAVLPISVAPDAQSLMVQNIKKLLPTTMSPNGSGMPNPGFPSTSIPNTGMHPNYPNTGVVPPGFNNGHGTYPNQGNYPNGRPGFGGQPGFGGRPSQGPWRH